MILRSTLFISLLVIIVDLLKRRKVFQATLNACDAPGVVDTSRTSQPDLDKDIGFEKCLTRLMISRVHKKKISLI